MMLTEQAPARRMWFIPGPGGGDRAAYALRCEQLAWLSLENAYRELADVSLCDGHAVDSGRRRVRDRRRRLEAAMAAAALVGAPTLLGLEAP